MAWNVIHRIVDFTVSGYVNPRKSKSRRQLGESENGCRIVIYINQIASYKISYRTASKPCDYLRCFLFEHIITFILFKD